MGKMYVETKSIIEHVFKNIEFMQPIYEAIINSLEAHATLITVDFFKEDKYLISDIAKIQGFKITDNGDGFTDDNIEAFNKLWTRNKYDIGCKGSGRFTWLSVFSNINIKSCVVKSQNIVTIPFTLEYDKEDVKKEKSSILENETCIDFSNVTPKFYDVRPGTRKNIDKRVVADLLKLKEDIEDYLLIRLSYLKNNQIPFKIILRLDGEEEIIEESNLTMLSSKNISIESEIDHQKYDFNIYYKINKDNRGTTKINYCSNMRAVKLIEKNTLGLNGDLPNKDSIIIFICSSYFDGKDNDSRNDFDDLIKLNHGNIEYPLVFSDIIPYIRKTIQEIIFSNYPEVVETNIKIETEAVNEAPYLLKYIEEDNSTVKNKDVLLKTARKKFDDDKQKCKEKFQSILMDHGVTNTSFIEAVNEISDIAAAELGEYIVYRQNIIDALKASIGDETKDEGYIHNIIMRKRTSIVKDDDYKYALSNLWLIDDKFMTYTYASSDIPIDKIKKEIAENNPETYHGKNRPDLTMFFDVSNGYKNLIVIELKGSTANKYEKKKAITEIADNIEIIRRNIPNINIVWSYIITSIDDEFKRTVINQDYKQLFSSEDDYRMFYKYCEHVAAHSYVVDLNSIVSDANARNSVFMDILKKKR